MKIVLRSAKNWPRCSCLPREGKRPEEPSAATVRKATTAAFDHPKQKSLQPILFQSRQLKPAETRHWPTELEMAGIVWVVKKIRHLIGASNLRTIIYTDHSAAVGLVRQTSLNTVSVEKLNLRSVRASEYLQRFLIEIRHKPGKAKIVPDALSRLASRDYQSKVDSYKSELDALSVDAFSASLIQVSERR